MDRLAIVDDDRIPSGASTTFRQRMSGRVRRSDGQSPSCASGFNTICRQIDPRLVAKIVWGASRRSVARGSRAAVASGAASPIFAKETPTVMNGRSSESGASSQPTTREKSGSSSTGSSSTAIFTSAL
jgi:hypothetical protein